MSCKNEVVVQIGCGVVGSAYCSAYKHHGFKVIGVDVVDSILNNLTKLEIENYHPNNLPKEVNADIILMSLPTPCIYEEQKLDLKYLWSTLPTVKQLIDQSTGKTPIVVIRSTVPPGFTLEYEKELKKLTDNKFFVSFQPEFLRAVSNEQDALYPWKVLFGVKDNEEDEVIERLSDILLQFVNNDRTMLEILKLEEAEFFKLVHNYSNAQKISFANTMYGIANHLNKKIDIQKILYLATETAESFLSKKYGLRVGAPFGGTCLPKDSCQMFGLAPEGPLKDFIGATIDVNHWIKENESLRRELEVSPNWVDYKFMKAETSKTSDKDKTTENVKTTVNNKSTNTNNNNNDYNKLLEENEKLRKLVENLMNDSKYLSNVNLTA